MITFIPSGLFQSDASLAKNLLYDTPTDMVNCVFSFISFLILLATSNGSSSICEISKYASSIDNGSTKSDTLCNMVNICLDTSLYFSYLTGKNIPFGHFCFAIHPAIAE